jgi:hypothetical protein
LRERSDFFGRKGIILRAGRFAGHGLGARG